MVMLGRLLAFGMISQYLHCIAEYYWGYVKVYYNEHEQKIRTKGVVQPLGRMHLPLDMKMINLTA